MGVNYSILQKINIKKTQKIHTIYTNINATAIRFYLKSKANNQYVNHDLGIGHLSFYEFETLKREKPSVIVLD